MSGPRKATGLPGAPGRAAGPLRPGERDGRGSARGWVIGVDSGGSGLRVALARAEDGGQVGDAIRAAPVRTGPGGIDAGHLLAHLLPAVRELLSRAGAGRAGRRPGEPGAVAAMAVGAAGMATLGDELRARLPEVLAAELGIRRLALAADAVTAYAGALGQRTGAVVAAGTGVIALGAELEPSPEAAPASGPAVNAPVPGGRWRRADGWGHLLGDCGGGAWIGRAGLEAALRAHDGRRGGSPALLARLEAVFGPAAGLPALLYPRTDRAAVLASFAPEVAACAGADPVAAGILRDAARAIAETAAAVCPPATGCPVAFTGGLLGIGPPLLEPLREELSRLAPRARPVDAEGGPLDGALRIAGALAAGGLRLPVDGNLLDLRPRPPAP